MLSIIQLNYRHEKEATAILARAFKDDPLYLHVFKTPEQIALFTKYLYQKALNQKEMLIGSTMENQLNGVACVEKTRSRLTLSFIKPSFLFINYRFFSKLPWQTFRFFNQYGRIRNGQKPKEPHYCLNWLAVDPAVQGSGIGAKLLNYIHAFIDNDSTVKEILLNTENPRNIDYYKKFGYELRDRRAIGKVTIYSMARIQDKHIKAKLLDR